ncbi:amidohydrolase family protein [Ketobacter sp. MCCC 1A13808]|uniref:amidohydrolase family protein n=1 Tax=Ketobacter sp. MCCC 1A13808 TaxID=2602738 RepID=UPI000F13B265|nr:amidohydrolase family protein [Ketobacter sp. MCCC 1A13808]MVF13430.1 amidohydrolase family protein [Ketobacter sp. MCCC 1A13808]RLP52949.1 MAG: hydrolase [Ketobacter sp.]
MLIKDAEIYQTGLQDVRIERGIISAMGQLERRADELLIDARGSALLPGLNDHHIHFLSYAASLASIDCGTAAVKNQDQLVTLLQQQAAGAHWLRGYGYHETVAGEIDCRWLDRYGPDRPIRIQHRSGRLWIFNSAGIAIIRNALRSKEGAVSIPVDGLQSGRFYDADQQLASLIGRRLPPVKQASEKLASYGITGFSDMTPSNDQDAFELFQNLKSKNTILQQVQLARRCAFESTLAPEITPGPVKVHLHENRLPSLEELVERITISHQAGVSIAVHCVTEVELMFSLAAFEEAGPISGDRIEHGSVTPEYLLDRIVESGVTVVTQPHFILEKGDTYLSEIDVTEHQSLYRGQTFLQRKIPLAGSSDAPFGSADPWTAMRTAVARRTSSGQSLGSNEALSPEQALALFLGSLETPGKVRCIQPGMSADLCLLSCPWEIARVRLNSHDVRLVISKGTPIFSRDQSAIRVNQFPIAGLKP